MLRDENSCPKKSWLKYKCKVKRNPIPSFAAAKRMLEELSGGSSSDVRGGVQAEILQESLLHSPSVVVEELSNKNAQDAQHEDLPPAENSLPMQPSPLPAAGFEELSPQEDTHGIQTVQYVTYDTAHESDTVMESEIQKSLNLIIQQQQETNIRLDRLEKRTAGIGIQNDFILDKVRNFSSGKTDIELASSFCFEPIKDDQELADLEQKLADNDFKLKMINWLRLNATGDCADNRMLGVLDLLLTREFQTKCTWTGASRKGPKTAIMPNRNVLQLFVEVGSNESETVTQQKLASFFKRKLKNSLKRLLTTGMRRGTRHVRRRKQQAQAAEHVKFEPDGVHDEERDNPNRSDPESGSYASSIINSSDALEAVDIESDSSGPNPNDSSE
ncbi:hypothetical protein RP20_CCG021241 [Aedes albopictus]|nr:hypothetical protein RP20_CCG001775 [Aedes albopictus]KXJ71199.1 hypothetical protein RP20_CCG021241 [Aedes albopictus]